MLRCMWVAPLAVAMLLVAPVRATPAQDEDAIVTQVKNCVNGEPTFAAGRAAAKKALDLLLWKTAHADYVAIQSKLGAVAALDSIAARGTRLMDLTWSGEAAPVAPVRDTINVRIARARGELELAVSPDGRFLKHGATVTSASVRFGGSRRPGNVNLGGDLNVEITDGTTPAVVALCATAWTAANFLEYMDTPALSRVAKSYATAEKHWQLFVESGYSMTLIERLAASCRLSFVGALLSPVRNCSTDPGRSLEPPSQQIIFLHPVAALVPLLKKDSVYQQAVIVELYGYLHHSYSDTKLTTLGVSIASSHAEVGPMRVGGVLHTPWGSVGAFGRKSAGPLYTVSADILGWVPSIRQAARTVRFSGLEKAMGTIADGVNAPGH